jgi:hypothetical protein
MRGEVSQNYDLRITIMDCRFGAMYFEEYLISKKIDSKSFKEAEPARWEEWRSLFDEMSPSSFTAQKLYLINPTRRKYLLKISETVAPKVVSAAPKPVMKPKPKIN